MHTIFIGLGYSMAALTLYNMYTDQPEAARFTTIMCGIFTILQKLYS